MKKHIWDCLHSGFVFNATHVTYSHEQAALFEPRQVEALVNNRNQHRFMAVDPHRDRPEHPSYATLTVAYSEMVEVTEEGYSNPKTLPKNGSTYPFLLSLGQITHEVSLGYLWYFEYRHELSGRSGFGMAETNEDVWDQALLFARKQMGGRGDRPAYAMAAYLRARRQQGLVVDLSTPLAVALCNDPRRQQKKAKYAVGDVYTFGDEKEKQAYRRRLLRDLISKRRHSVVQYSRSYGRTLKRATGKLNTHQKQSILDALVIFDAADRIEVAGISTESAYILSPNGASALSDAHHCYQFAFLATVGDRRLVLLTEL